MEEVLASKTHLEETLTVHDGRNNSNFRNGNYGINFDESNIFHVILLFWRIQIQWTGNFCARSLRVSSRLFSRAPKICEKGVLRGLVMNMRKEAPQGAPFHYNNEEYFER